MSRHTSLSASAHRVGTPDRVLSYFHAEWLLLLIITISGLIYNVGLLAGPWFEGQLAQCLVDIYGGSAGYSSMVRLALGYVAAIAIVQISRFIKRLFVRFFANNINRSMKQVIYGNLIHKSRAELEDAGAGSLMTRAISDVDACAEGMRKFTTEVFDTGVALVSYIVMLLVYDWRLALLCLLFPPISYCCAEKMKTVVTRTNFAFRKSAERLSSATIDRVSGALTYRVYGCEPQRNEEYETHLDDYETTAVLANVFVQAMPPLYLVISEISVLFILYCGVRNVLGTGSRAWDVAAFTTFLSCYMKMSVKSSKAAKLFNAVHKAEVSWKRIKPLMKEPPQEKETPDMPAGTLTVRDLSFTWPAAAGNSETAAGAELDAASAGSSEQNAGPGPDAASAGSSEQNGGPGPDAASAGSSEQNAGPRPVFSGLSFQAAPGEIIGVTGPVACGKSSFGKTFLCENPYEGSICFDGCELSELPEEVRRSIIGYLGHAPELFSDTIRNNVLLRDETGAEGTLPYTAAADAGERHTHDDDSNALLTRLLDIVCFAEEIKSMPDGVNTLVGDAGVRLSGGQQQRLALARTLAFPRPVYILDDPFSALDRATEMQIFRNLKKIAGDTGSIFILLSHRLYLFKEMNAVIWMENGKATVSTHEALLDGQSEYRALYEVQCKEGGDRA